jgi:hypothetical protein
MPSHVLGWTEQFMLNKGGDGFLNLNNFVYEKFACNIKNVPQQKTF